MRTPSRDRPLVLVVEHARRDSRALAERLERQGFEVAVARDGEEADNVLERRAVSCVVTELRGPRVDGLALMRRALKRTPSLCVVIVAENESVEAAVEAMREGAYDVLVRPLRFERLLAVLRRGTERQALESRVAEMEGQLDERLGLERLTGPSRAIHRVLEQVRAVASTRAAVLIEGEPGTGKRLVAQTIHRNGPRRDERFVWANCSAPAAAVEGDLFGYEASAGVAARPGRFELADGGTLFLDEVGDAPPAVQVRLLRAVQERAFERVGGTRSRVADVRLIASTSRDLDAESRAGRFRADLLARLAVVRIAMPPLRARNEDLPLLVDGFIREFDAEHGRAVTALEPGAMEALTRYAWPGNVRELKSVIEGMIVAAGSKKRLELTDVPASVRGRSQRGTGLELTVGMTVAEAERRLIEATLRHTGGDKPRAAAMLGIGLRTLYRKLDEYGVG